MHMWRTPRLALNALFRQTKNKYVYIIYICVFAKLKENLMETFLKQANEHIFVSGRSVDDMDINKSPKKSPVVCEL